MHLLTLLQLAPLPLVQTRLVGRTMRGRSSTRNLGRWSFDEPCIAGPIFYENPNEGTSNFDAELKQYTRTNGRIYEDEDFSTETTVHTDTICNLVEDNHVICDCFMVDDTVGVFSLFSGLAELEFAHHNHNSNGTEFRPIGKGRYVFQGGSDLHGGIIGKVNTLYEEDLITHDFCVQGSTYDHVIPPLLSDMGTSNRSVSTRDEETNASASATASDNSSTRESSVVDETMMLHKSCVTLVAMSSLILRLLLS